MKISLWFARDPDAMQIGFTSWEGGSTVEIRVEGTGTVDADKAADALEMLAQRIRFEKMATTQSGQYQRIAYPRTRA